MVTAFQKRVYDLCKKIPKGKISTYGALSKALKASPQAVGQALRANPFAPRIPCHRVVASDGKIGGFNGRTKGKAITKKARLLKKEGVRVMRGRVVGFAKLVHKF